MAEKNVVVKVDNITKKFRIPLEASSGIKQKLINILKGRKGYRIFTPLKNISFEVHEGDFFGIVGRNGSGKSTLLKTIAGIYTPNGGAVHINGKLVPFIELGVGFNPELTGRENIFLNGALLGFSHKEMEAMYDEIVDFAELGDFMDERLKNYSSGMQVRLAFSIAIKAKGDILILDEVLAVGDEAFQRKCDNFFSNIKKDKSKTVILVTHSMNDVERYCDKAIMLRDGVLASYGSPSDMANEYSLENLTTTHIPADNKASKIGSLIKGLKVDILSTKNQINQTKKLKIRVSYVVDKNMPTKINLSLHDIDRNVPIFATSSQLTKDKTVSMVLSLNLNQINDANIKVSVSIRDESSEILHFMPDSVAPVVVFRRSDYLDMKRKTTWALLFSRGEWNQR